jgi:acetolactate synthase-1/2/3 large subunit
MTRSGGELLVDQLLVNGAELVFCVPGESYLPALDAFYQRAGRIRLISCRHDGAAAFMAEACGKLSGRPGVCFVTRGPGATNASIAVHVARQDSTPMLLVIGQVPRRHLGRDAVQEIDYAQMFGSLAKHVEQITDVDAIPAAVARAWAVALSDRPGPAVLAIPEDVLSERTAAPDAAPILVRPRAPEAADIAALRRRLEDAARPMVLVGGGCWDSRAIADLIEFVRSNALPVCSAFRRQDIFDNADPHYCGYLGLNDDPHLVARVTDADCVLVLGARLDQPTTKNYALFGADRPASHLVHLHPDETALARDPPGTLAICADVRPSAAALAAMAPVAQRWRAWLEGCRADYVAATRPTESPAVLDLGFVMRVIGERVAEDAIVALDAGNFTAWPQRYRRYRRPGRLIAPVNGAMGYGVPAAVAASLAYPDRTVLGFVGDGGMLMTGSELATAMHYGARPILMIVNNNMYGTIRLHQERAYPGRVIGTDLSNPNFAKLAHAFGADGAVVERNEDVEAALNLALSSTVPFVLELRTDPECLTPGVTISGLRAAGDDLAD